MWLVLITGHNKLAHNKISATSSCLDFHPSPNFSKTSSTSAPYSFFHVVYAPLKSWLQCFPQSPNAAREQPPPPITSPSCNVTPTAICMKCFLAAARARLQSEILWGGKRGKRCSENRRRRRGESCVSHQRSSEEKRAESEDKVSDNKSREGGKKQKSGFSCIGKWSYPPRESTSLRWRASRRSAAERFVTRAPKDICAHMHLERRLIFLFHFCFQRSICCFIITIIVIRYFSADCAARSKVTLRSLSRFSSFTGTGWVFGQVAGMVSKVSALDNRNTPNEDATSKTETVPKCKCLHFSVRGRAYGGLRVLAPGARRVYWPRWWMWFSNVCNPQCAN